MFNKIKYKKINDNCINKKEIKEDKNKTKLLYIFFCIFFQGLVNY